MKITKIQISNILGIKRLEFEPGKITTISGQNGSGKTSVLEAIKAAVGGGHDATLIRNGATDGRVVIDLDNGETLIKKMTNEESKVILEDDEGRRIVKAATYIKEIIDPVGLNPIGILTAKPKERVDMLLGSVPMDTPVDEIRLITGVDVSDETRHPLKVIDEKRKNIFDDRAYVNGEVKRLKAMVDAMEKTIPFHPDQKDWEAEAGRLRYELGIVNAGKEKETLVADKAMSWEIDKVKADAQQEIDKVKEDMAVSIGLARNLRETRCESIGEKHALEFDSLTPKIAEAEQNAKVQIKISGAMEFIEKNKKEVALREEDSVGMTGQIKSLDILKAELLANLPVPGLEIKDGDVWVGGVPFDTLNQAARISFALTVAGLRKTKLPLVCVDGLEAMDEKVFEAFRVEAEKTDMQFFVTRVSEEKSLTIA